MDLYEAVETICKDYCKYPDIESGNKLADICDKCPMNKCEDLRWAYCKTEPMKTGDYCDICKQDMCEFCIADASNPYCVPSHYEIKQTETSTNSEKLQSGVELKQTDCHWK